MYPYPQMQKDNSEIKSGINSGLAGTIMIAVTSNLLSIIIMSALTFIASFVIYDGNITQSANTIKNTLINVVSYDNVYGLIFNILLYLLCMFLPFLVVCIVRRYRVKELISFKKPKAIHLGYGVFITLGVSVVAQVLMSIFLNILSQLGIAPDFPDISMNPSSPAAVSLYFFFISVMPAVFEEFAMRGVVLGSLKNYSTHFAILFSSLLFSLMHGTLQQIPYAFIIGLSIGYFVVKFNSIWIGIAIHFANNLLSCIYEFLSYRFDETVIVTINNMMMGVMLVFGILFIIIFALKERFALDTSNDTHTLKECLSVMFRRPLFYITIVIYVIMTYVNGYIF